MKELTDLLAVNKTAICILGVMIILDIVSGIIKAVIAKDLKSSILREGLLKKLLELIVVIVAFACDILLGVKYIGNIVIIAFVGMEGLSILENAGEYIPLPEGLKNILEALKSKGDTIDG